MTESRNSWSPRRSVGSQASFLAGSTAIAQGLVALVYLFAARGSEPSEFGLTIAAIALGLSAVGFIDFGTGSHWVREFAGGRMTNDELGRRTAVKVFVSLLLGLLWLGISLVFFPSTQLWIASPIMVAFVVNMASAVPLRGRARGELVAISIVAERVVAAGLFFVLLFFNVGPATTILWISLVLGSLTATCINWQMTSKSERPLLSLRPLGNPWQGSRYFGIAAVANGAQNLDLAVLAAVAGPAAAGLYGAVNRWTQPMTLLAGAFSSAAAPFIAQSADIHSAWISIRRSIWMPLGAVAVSLFVFLTAPILVPFLLGISYEGSVDILRVLALACIPSIISQPLYVTLQFLGYDKFVAVTMTILVIPQLLLVIFLGSSFGAMGAAWVFLGFQLVLVSLLGTAVLRVVQTHKRKLRQETNNSAT